MDKSEFIEELEKKGIKLNDIQLNKFEIYFNILVEWNEKMNLTNITNEEEVYEKHFFDSISLSFNHKLSNELLCDVGAGAGFPSIPLKIVFPNLKIKIIEPLNKRVTFLNHLIKSLDLNDVEAINIRAEDYDEGREKFDIVTARAVAKLSILSELCLPLVKKDGYFIALKGKNGMQEIEEARNGIKKLGGLIENIKEFELPNKENRTNINIKKVINTPDKYPRHYSKIKKAPL